MKNSVVEFGVPVDKKTGALYLDSFNNIDDLLLEHIEEIKKSVISGEIVTLDTNAYWLNAIATLHENGLVIDITQRTDAASYKYDDAGRSRLYVFEDGMTYVVTEVDFRLNKEKDVNQEIVAELNQKIGKSLEIPEAEKEPQTIYDKARNILTAKKREMLRLKRELYLSKLQVGLDKIIIANQSKGK